MGEFVPPSEPDFVRVEIHASGGRVITGEVWAGDEMEFVKKALSMKEGK